MNAPAKPIKTKLFIGNLDPATQSSELSELFAPFGNVLEASVIKDYGFVHYGTIEEAEKAAQALNNKEFHGKRLRVELSTSTVRHRPGQPEPASALRNSRTRAAAMASGNGISRYSPSIPPGGVGPIRHNASTWIRNDVRPYDGIPMDPNVMTSGYGPPSALYDRSRPYDARVDPRAYYDDRRDGGFNPGYDTTRDNYYGASGYSNSNGEPPGMYPMRDYRDLPHHTRVDHSMGYNTNRMYDRNQDTSPVDPYYGGGVPQGPPPSVDPYQNYDPYQKYYSGRPREAEYSISTSHNPHSREYDAYSNYQPDPYAPPPLRSDLAVSYQQPQPAGYPPANHSRPPHVYGNTHGVLPPSSPYAPPLPQYYGAQQRA